MRHSGARFNSCEPAADPSGPATATCRAPAAPPPRAWLACRAGVALSACEFRSARALTPRAERAVSVCRLWQRISSLLETRVDDASCARSPRQTRALVASMAGRYVGRALGAEPSGCLLARDAAAAAAARAGRLLACVPSTRPLLARAPVRVEGVLAKRRHARSAVTGAPSPAIGSSVWRTVCTVTAVEQLQWLVQLWPHSPQLACRNTPSLTLLKLRVPCHYCYRSFTQVEFVSGRVVPSHTY